MFSFSRGILCGVAIDKDEVHLPLLNIHTNHLNPNLVSESIILACVFSRETMLLFHEDIVIVIEVADTNHSLDQIIFQFHKQSEGLDSCDSAREFVT